MPTTSSFGRAGDDATVDGSAWTDGERGQDAIGASPRGELRFPWLFHRSFLRQGRYALMGTKPSRKGVRRLLQRVHNATTPHKHAESPERRVAALNRLLRDWAAYFNRGPVLPTYKLKRW